MDCEKCDNCPFEYRIKTLESENERNRNSHSEIYSRLNVIERNDGIAETQFNQIIKSLDELKTEIQEIKDKPAKRWDVIINSALQWIVVAVLAAITFTTK